MTAYAYRNISIKQTAQVLIDAGFKPAYCPKTPLATQAYRLEKQCLSLGIKPLYK